MASIEKRNGKWRARWRTPDGASRSLAFDRKIDAEKHLASIEHSRHTGAYVDPSDGRRTFGEWWAEWSAAAALELRLSTVARNDSYGRNMILPAFQSVSLGRIDHLSVQRWVGELSAAGKAPATVAKAYQLLGGALRAAVRARLIPNDPSEGVRLPKVERDEMRFLTPAEVAALAETIGPEYRAFVLLGAYGGLRFGELAGLRRSKVDLLRRKIDVAEILVEVRGHHHYGPPKTRAGRRSVPLPRVATVALDDHAAGLEGDALVFTAPNGGALRASLFRRRVWAPAVDAAGLAPLRIHDLRHSAVAFWIAAGASPKEVAARAGHASVVTVLDRYGHLLPGSEDRVNDALDAMAEAALVAGAPIAGLA
jgi:integrase